MKIGILTYHRAENYGALLQAYALKTYLSGLGHDVSFVDYWPDYHREYFELFSWNMFKNGSLRDKAVSVYYLLFWYRVRKKRKDNLQEFIHREFGLSSLAKYHTDHDVVEDYDCVVYGSDQIWRKQNMKAHPGFDYWYFGSDNIRAKKVTYAASMGSIDVKDEEKKSLRVLLSGFSTISVRESSLKDFLVSLGVNSQLVVDPVFLLPQRAWYELMGKVSSDTPTSKYILVYNLLGQKDTTLFAKELSKETGLATIEINKKYTPFSWGRKFNHTATVETFLSLINNAEYVVSNSFHGVAMSIIFNKQFYVVGMKGRGSRVVSLLELLNIEDRFVTDGKKPSSIIEYASVMEKLAKTVECSEEFINKSILQ